VGSRDLFFERPGATLRLRDEGAGPALVFLHGWAFDLEIWEPQARVLSSGHRVIRFDRRGFGLSTGEPSLELDFEDLLALLEHLRLERVGLIGASQGARVALRAALAAPRRVSCVVLDAPPDCVSDESSSLTADEVPLGEYGELARGGDLAAVRRAWSRHPFTWLWSADPALQAWLAEIIARYPGRDLLRLDAGSAPSLGASVHELAAPVLIVNGEHDTAARLAAGLLLGHTLPNARRVLIPGAGHLPNLDHPQLYNETLAQFLQGVSR
jgi:pimeloyl-ACP methyl ester carboxylesterase